MDTIAQPTAPAKDLEFNPLDPAFIADPYPFYRRLREAAPVMKTPQGFWLITRYEDVALSLRDRRFGKDFEGNMRRRYGTDRMNEPAVASLAKTMLVQDPPDHTRLRGLVTKAITARRVADMRPRIKELVDEQLDRVADKGEMDVMRDLAHRLPVIVICDMLGIPEEHRAPFLAGSNVNGRILEPVPMTREELDLANRNTQMAGVYFNQLCELRRREPKDDLTTELVKAEEAGDKLTAEELQANIGLLFGAGHETTTNLIGNGFLYAMRNRDQWERLVSDTGLAESAVEEFLRYDGPSGALARVAGADIEMGGRTIRQGQRVFAFMNAANRDPEAFEDPERFDIGREPNAHLTFGHGIHFCLGAPLARLEAQIATTRLAERLPGIRLSGGDPEWHDSLILRGVKRLPVQLV